MKHSNRASTTIVPPALVMNVFYTGLGIARSLGERGIPVIGLTSRRGIYGNFTRHAKTVICPDSRSEPEALLAFLIALGRKLGARGVIFPTRDDDVVFLDRFRTELDPYFSMVLAGASSLHACLNKWETYLWAEKVGLASPKSWIVERRQDVQHIAHDVSYPCVLKPLAAHYWRRGANWQLVGARKVIGINSEKELLQQYDAIARADERVLLQEMIPGGDENLMITACYLNLQSQWVAGFNTRKLVQVPETFGTGCIVESVSRPELFEPARELLQAMGFTGIAEVEFKWDARDKRYKLIEVNPRAWDQHRLGKDCGVDLMYIAYCEHAGLPAPPPRQPVTGCKWIAEETMITTALRMAWRRDPKVYSLFRQARGKRIYAIWSWNDPLPFTAFLFLEFIPGLLAGGIRGFVAKCKGKLWPAIYRKEGGLAYESSFEKPKGLS